MGGLGIGLAVRCCGGFLISWCVVVGVAAAAADMMLVVDSANVGGAGPVAVHRMESR